MRNMTMSCEPPKERPSKMVENGTCGVEPWFIDSMISIPRQQELGLEKFKHQYELNFISAREITKGKIMNPYDDYYEYVAEQEKKNPKITEWYKQNKDGDFIFNHIENGWADTDKPNVISNRFGNEQNDWKNYKWQKQHTYAFGKVL